MEGFLRSHTMGSTNVACRGKELGEACGSKTPMMVRQMVRMETRGWWAAAFVEMDVR
jgi:hypothetical protein